jgi:hypothetical protein
MKRAAFILATSSILMAACNDVAGPTGPPFLLLSGVWDGTTGSGDLIKIATTASGGRISGIGIAYTMSGVDTLRIAGQFSYFDGSFGLDIQSDDGQAAAYTGQIQSTDSLTGDWTDWTSGRSYPVVFVRLPVPPCADSVPLIGTPASSPPGVIVFLHAAVNADTEATRLGTLYGFTPTSLSDAPKSFDADLPLATVTVLRCEPAVDSVRYLPPPPGP